MRVAIHTQMQADVNLVSFIPIIAKSWTKLSLLEVVEIVKYAHNNWEVTVSASWKYSVQIHQYLCTTISNKDNLQWRSMMTQLMRYTIEHVQSNHDFDWLNCVIVYKLKSSRTQHCSRDFDASMSAIAFPGRAHTVVIIGSTWCHTCSCLLEWATRTSCNYELVDAIRVHWSIYIQ